MDWIHSAFHGVFIECVYRTSIRFWLDEDNVSSRKVSTDFAKLSSVYPRSLGCSCICTTFGFMMASLSTEYWHYILSQGVVLGVGLGSSFTPSVACVTSYYKKKRGLANALLSSGSAVSGLVIPIYLSKMINNPKIGLDWALRTSGFLCFVFQGLAWLVMKQKKLPPNHRPLLDFSVFRSPSYTCTVFAYMATVLGIFYPVFYIQSFARYKGVDKDTAFWSIAIFNGVSMIGRV